MSDKARVILYTILITVLCVLGARKALSDTFSIRGGADVSGGSPNGDSKIFGFRYETPLISGLNLGTEVGGYVDNTGNGRKGAALGKLQLGITPGPPVGIYGMAYTGPCGISSVDVLLGSNFQFCTDFGAGIRDTETFIGVTYSHISNAGIKLPNRGRDYLVMGMGFQFE